MNAEKIKRLTKRIENLATKKYICNKLLHNVEHADNNILNLTTVKYSKILHNIFDSLDYNTLNQIELQLLDDMDKTYKNKELLKIYDRLDLQIITYLHKKISKTKQCNRNLVM